jgi:outer membrane protein OmpA-like peptidoglycan-associated protein
MIKKILFVVVFTITSITINAQEFLGIRQSNYSGVMGLDLNPASIADNRMKMDMVIFGASVYGYNNHAYFNPKHMPYGWVKSFNADDPKADAWMNNEDLNQLVSADSIDFYNNKGIDQFVEFNNGNKDRSAFVNTEIDIFNIMISINQKISIGFQIKNRTLFNLDKVSPELIRLVSREFDYQQLFNLSLQDANLNLSMNSWNEYNFAYAQVLKDDNQHFWKVGGKLKFLQGIGSFYFYSDNVDYNIQNDSTANYIQGDFDYGYSDNLGGYIEPVDGSNEEFSAGEFLKKASNFGLGLDLGVVYEWRPNYRDFKYDMDNKTDLWRKDQNKYKVRVGAAINDIGGMTYKKGALSRNFSFNTSNFDLETFDGIEGFRSLDSTLINLSDSGDIAFRSDDGRYFMNLPTHANIDVDYHVWKNIYANYYMRLNLLFMKDRNAVHYPNNFAVTPRWEKRWWGVSLPLSYNTVAGFRYGVGLRAGPVVVGTGDIKPFFAAGKDTKIRGGDFYVALKLPIPYGRPKDRDKDKISDKLDVCIDVPGVWAFKGCPDTDNDGIQDTEDDCPLDSGIVEFKGCPDTDRDGIMDKLDSCVTDSGLVKFNGCPDRDGDDIMDKEDDCPGTPGIPAFNGCPDTDGDGLMDKEDRCPTVPGPISNKGCPLKLLHSVDSINQILASDTLLIGKEKFDFNNLPPDKSYLFELDASDGEYPPYLDVVLQNGDIATSIRAFKKDSTHYAYTFVPKGAALELTKEEEEILNTAFANLEFETGKTKIKEASLPSLIDLALLLGKKPEWALSISGHTDSQGAASSNLRLSKGRAQAVAEFLTKAGIDANRFDVKWFGETKPIGDNKTKEGRQQNRRVEMTVIQN